MWTELLGNLAVSGMYSPEIVAVFNQICQILSCFLQHIANGAKVDLQKWIHETVYSSINIC